MSVEINGVENGAGNIDAMLNEDGAIKASIWRRAPIGRYLRKIPRKKHLRNSWLHKKFGDRFLSADYWQPTRGGVSKGFAIGCFWAMIPMPFQMIPSGICAMFLRANIPLALLACWITNPFTHPFVIVFQLWLGEKLLNEPSSLYILENDGILELIKHAPAPIITGASICAVLFPVFGFFASRFVYDLTIKKIIASYNKERKK